MITSTDIEQLSGLSLVTINQWIVQGYLNPEVPARGHGSKRGYTLMQAVAVVQAGKLRRLGCTSQMLAPIVRYVANMSEEELADNARHGRTFLLPLPTCPELVKPPVTNDKDSERKEWVKALDLLNTYREVAMALPPTEVLPLPLMVF